MGAVRFREMQAVKRTLGISTMKVLDYEDSGLKEMDPRILEDEISKHIVLTRPHIVVTYPVHGGSGFHDHLVTYAVVKRAYLELKGRGVPYLRRLAFFTMPDSGAPSILPDGWPRLRLSEPGLIDCIVHLNEEDVQAMKDALSCYESYKEMVQKIGVIEKIGNKVHFEIAFETHDPPLKELTEQVPDFMPRTFSASFF
jgi:LmbE family N-acetylglucosaminyl deacetylase